LPNEEEVNMQREDNIDSRPTKREPNELEKELVEILSAFAEVSRIETSTIRKRLEALPQARELDMHPLTRLLLERLHD
jgi:hypothetical protein